MVSIGFLSTATFGATLVVLGTVGSAQAAIFSFSTSDSPFTAGVANQGAWSTTASNVNTNDSYFVGRTARGDTFRNFFTFDLSSLRFDTILSATLQLQRYRGAGNPTQTITLFDVSTPAARLNNNQGRNAAIFGDLGTGRRYGSFTRSTQGSTPPFFSFPLNNIALEDIFSAAQDLPGRDDDYFSIGSTLNLASPGPQSLFLNSGDAGVQRLVIEAVPEPSSVMGVLGFGAFGIGWMLKRRQKNQKKARSA